MVKCPECGEVLIDKDVGCPKCGKLISDEDKNAKTSGNSKNKIIAVIAIIVIIAIVGVIASSMFSNNHTASDSNVKNTDDNSVKNTPSSDNNTSSSNSVEYWSSYKSDKFHLPTCEWAEKISEDNKVVYNSRDTAIKDGKQPCNVCNP